MLNRLKCIFAAAMLASSAAALAVDGLSFEYGKSDSSHADVNLYRVSAQWDWKKKLIEIAGWHLGGYWETTFGYWDNNTDAKTHDSIFEFGFTPIFRLQPDNLNGFSAYAELGVGVHLLSHTSVGPLNRFSTAFQFGSHLGAGVRFGERGQYDVGYRYQHLSNGGIKHPNDGINFQQLRLQYHFQ